jgi:hypothetical protein
MTTVVRGLIKAIGIGIALLVAVVPAHALTTNTLLFEQTIDGANGGGNLSGAQITALIEANEALLGQDITLVGKINVGGWCLRGSTRVRGNVHVLRVQRSRRER